MCDMKNKKGFTVVEAIAIIIIIAIMAIIAIPAITNSVEERRFRSNGIRLLSNPDNAVFDNDLYAFANENDIILSIEHADDLEAIDLLEENSSDYDAIWLSNSTWVYMMDDVRTLNSKSININPVVFGIKKSKAQELGFIDKDVYNKDIVDAIREGKLKYVMSSVTKTNTGLIAYLGFLNVLAGSPEILTSEMLNDSRLEDELRTLFSGVERTSGSEDFLEQMFLNNSEYEAVIATESSLIQINKKLESENRESLYLIYPVDGVAINDSPFAYVDNGQDKLDNFNKLQSFILSRESQNKLEKLGKRTWYGGVKADADSSSFKKEWGIDTNKYLIPLKYPGKDVIDDALALYVDSLRKPSVTAFCLDFSGSMYGDGDRELKEAMEYILDYETAKKDKLQFSKSDIIHVIPFGSDVGNPMSTYNGRNTSDLISSIKELEPEGGTNLYGCAIKALETVNKESDDYTKTVILMTDGMANYGTYEDLRQRYSDYRNIPIYSIMFGNASRRDLEDIADLTNAKVFDGRVNLTSAFKEVRSYN